MGIATTAELKEELAFTNDLGVADDAMLGRHLVAAEAVIERHLGFTFAAASAWQKSAPWRRSSGPSARP